LAAVAEMLVTVGQADRGVGLARSLSDPHFSADALGKVALALVASGATDRAVGVAESIVGPVRESTLANVVYALTDVGKIDQALAAAGLIGTPSELASSLAAIATACAAAGSGAKATELAEDAEALARSLTSRFQAAEVLTAVAKAWAAIGQTARAIATARSIVDPWQDQAEVKAMPPYASEKALAEIAEVFGIAGDIELAISTAEEAGVMPSGYDNLDWRPLVALVASLATAGDVDNALVVAAKIGDHYERGYALATAAKALAAANDRTRCIAMAGNVEMIIESHLLPGTRAQMLTLVADALTDVQEVDRAKALATQAEAEARLAREWADDAAALVHAVNALREVDEEERAKLVASNTEILIRSITDAYDQSVALSSIAEAWARLGDTDRARTSVQDGEKLADSVEHPGARARALITVARVLVAAGDLDRAIVVATKAELVATSMPDGGWEDLYRDIAELLILAGDPDRGIGLARSVADSLAKARTLSSVVEVLTRLGDMDQAEIVALSMTETWGLIALAKAFLGAGRADRAEAVAQVLTTRPTDQSWALSELVDAFADAHELDRGEVLARLITDPYLRAYALTRIAWGLLPGRRPELAIALAGNAEALAELCNDDSKGSSVMEWVAEILVLAGQADRADEVAASIPYRLPAILTRCATALAEAGEVHLTAGLATRAVSVIREMSFNIQDRAAKLADVAQALLAVGDLEAAEHLAYSIDDQVLRGDSLGQVALAIARAGDAERAELVAQSISVPTKRAKTLLHLAEIAPPREAVRFVAEALNLIHWRECIDGLVKTRPDAFVAISAEVARLILQPAIVT
jgi:tetratricopeptide (TPR) repeat protein